MKENTKDHLHKDIPLFDATGIILAGGKSSRMGRDKSMLPLADSGETLIRHIFNGLLPLCKEILISSNSSDKFKLSGAIEISDIYPDGGPLSGIHAGLKKASYDYAFVCSCDLPFFNQDFAAYLLRKRAGYDLVIPSHGGMFEPLFAVYHKNAQKVIEEKLKRKEYKVAAVLEGLKALIVEEAEIRLFAKPEEIFYNVNTENDYQSLFQDLKGEK